MPRSTTALIVGGGISGLTLAYDLARHGTDLTVVEERGALGGLVSTVRREGFVMDGGPDAFLGAKPDARRLCEELGLAEEIIGTNPARRRVYVLHRGRLHPIPDGMRLTVPTRVGPLLLSRLFSLTGKLRLLAEPLVPRRAQDVEESIASFVTRRFGPEALDRIGEPLLAGIHCGDAQKLSMDALFPRLVELERRYGSVTRGLRASGEGSGETAFLSLRGGMGRLVEELSRRIPAESLVLGRGVREIERVAGGFQTTLASGERIQSRALVLALPIRDSERLLATLVPEAASCLAGISTVSTAVVFHGFHEGGVVHPLDGYGFVVPAGEPGRLLAATFVSTKFPGRAPSSHVLIRAFVGGMRDPEVLESSDEELEALTLSELQRVLGPTGTPVFSHVVRWRDRTPQVEVGHWGRVAELENRLAVIPGLWALGSGLQGVGIPDSVTAARRLAARVGEFLGTSLPRS